jgi:hypothetical protein
MHHGGEVRIVVFVIKAPPVQRGKALSNATTRPRHGR